MAWSGRQNTGRRTMKSAAEPLRCVRPRGTRGKRTAIQARGHSDYVTVEETRALLADSLGARSTRLAADDMVSTDEAAEIAGTTRVAINTWIDKGRCIGLTQAKRGYRLPRW